MTSLFDALFRGLGSDEVKPLPPIPSPEKGGHEHQTSPKINNAVPRTPSPTHTAHRSTSIKAREAGTEPPELDPSSPERSHSYVEGKAKSSIAMDPHEEPFHPTNESSYDQSVSMSTPGADISFGSQAVPFVWRRRSVTIEFPSRPPYNTPTSFQSHRGASVPIVIRPDPNDTNLINEGVSQTPEMVRRDSKELPPAHMSSWRKEQLKYMKKAKLGRDTKERPISALHGPLSLPYARNPSGVDATVADDSAYLSNVFGLRAAAHVRVHPSDGIRVSSDGTTVSSSSGKEENYTAVSKTRGVPVRPLVIKDPYQNIGIRRMSDLKAASVSDAASRGFKSDSMPAQGRPAVHSIHNDTASESLRGHKLSPIPGSPTVEGMDPFQGLFNQAITSATRKRSNTADLNDLHILHTLESFREGALPTRASYTDLKSLVHRSTTFVPAEPEYSAGHRIPSDESQVSDSIPLQSTPAKAHFATVMTPPQVSKADASGNWRAKPNTPSTVAQNRIIPAISITSPSMQLEQNSMTIDALFDKFNLVDESQKIGAITFKSPPSTANGPAPEVVTPKKSQTIKGTAAPVRIREPLGESNTSANVAVSHPKPMTSAPGAVGTTKKAATMAAKGTPNAGKLLKKKGEAKLPMSKKVVSMDEKGKGKVGSK